MIRLALLTVGARPGRLLGPFVALLLAMIVSAGSGIVLETALRSNPTAGTFAEAAVVVGGPQHPDYVKDSESYESVQLPERVRVPRGVTERVEGAADAAAVVAYRPLPAVLDRGESSSLEAVVDSWSMATVSGAPLVEGRPPRAADEMVLTDEAAANLSVQVSDRLAVQTLGQHRAMRVVGLVGSPTAEGLPPRVFVSTETADDLAGDLQPELLAVVADGGDARQVEAEIEAALRGADAELLTPAQADLAASWTAAGARQDLTELAGTFGGIALFVTLFVAASTMALAVRQRARDTALLRALAATPRQVRLLTVAEATVVALAACAAGCVPAQWVAAAAVGSLQDHDLIPAYFQVSSSWVTYVSAAGGVLAVAILAAYVAGRRAARSRPSDALRDAAVEPSGLGAVRLLAGLVVLAGACVLATIRMPGGGGASTAATGALVVMALMLAVGVLGPVIAFLGSTLLSPFVRLAGRSGPVASANSRAYSRRTAAAATSVALVVSLAVLAVVVPALIGSATDTQARERTRASVALSAGTVGFTIGEVADLGTLDGVDAAVGLVPTAVIRGRISTVDYAAQIVVGGSPEDVLDLDLVDGDLGARWTDGIALSSEIATGWGAAIGDEVEILLGDGTLAHPVVTAIFARSLGFADVLLPWRLAAGHVARPAVPTVLLGSSTTDASDIATAAAAQLDRPDVTVLDRAALVDAQDEQNALDNWLTRRLLALVALMAAVAVVNTLLMITLERRREFTAMQLVGATRSQIRGMVRSETLSLWLVGTGVGSVIGLVAVAPLVRQLHEASLPRTDALSMGLLGLGLALTCTLATSLGVTLTLRRGRDLSVGRD